MGGKVWSEEEERVFWTEIVPSSTKRHLMSKPYANDAKGWEALRKVMQANMGRRARRKYTALMLYEHYFQNSVLERFSPNATKFVREYIRKELFATGQAPSERSRSIMRYVQRGSGSGRRPKNASQVPMAEGLDEDGTPISDQAQAQAQVQAQDSALAPVRQHVPSTMDLLLNPEPADFPVMARELPPMTGPVHLPPLAPLEPQVSAPVPILGNDLSALCEPDYSYAPPAYPPPAYPPPTYEQSSFLETTTYQDHGYQTAPAYNSPVYQPAPFEAPVYANPAYANPTYANANPILPYQAAAGPVEAAEDSMFMKQEQTYAGYPAAVKPEPQHGEDPARAWFGY